MKLSINKQNLRIIVVSLGLIVLSMPYCYSNHHQNISTHSNGSWTTNITTRSLTSCPFTVYLDDGILTIENTSPDYDLTISITNCQTGEEVYQSEVNRSASSYMVIPLTGAAPGEYLLSIRNPEGGEVYGYFTL